MILSSDLREIILAHIYRRLSASQQSAALRFADVEEDLQAYVGVMLIRSALKRLNDVDPLLETDLYRGKDGLLHWKIKSLSKAGEKYIETKLKEERSITSRLLKYDEPLSKFF